MSATSPTAAAWPAKQRELQNHHMDSTYWNGFEFRDGDIVIATWAKSGTTWMQQVVGQLLFDGAEDVPIMHIAPWVERRMVPREKVHALLAAQEHRRFMKTHLPVDALVFSDKARYVYVARDGRDALWSWFNHHHAYNDAAYEVINGTPGLAGPPLPRPGDDVVAYFREWLARDGYPAWPFFSNVRSWWEIRHLPNVLLVHFNDLKADLAGSMQRIAAFLDIEVDPSRWPQMVEHCTFDYMKRNADRIAGVVAARMDGGAERFIHKGSNGRWQGVLPDADSAAYEAAAMRELGPDCARWLAQGGTSA